MKIEKSFWDVLMQSDNQVLVRHTLALMVPDEIKEQVVRSYNREAQIWIDMQKDRILVTRDGADGSSSGS